MNLEGIFPAVTTPFAADGAVSLPRLRENIARYNQTRLAGYVINGSTGESVLLRWDEIDRIWEAAREAAAPGKTLIAGTAAESTAETIEHTNRAAALGYDAALVRTPHYFKPQMTAEALYRVLSARSGRRPHPRPALFGADLHAVNPQGGCCGAGCHSSEHHRHERQFGRSKRYSGNPQSGPQRLPPAGRRDFRSARIASKRRRRSGAGGSLRFPRSLHRGLPGIQGGRLAPRSGRAGKLTQAANLFGPRHGIAGLKYAMDCVGFYGGPARPPLLPVNAAAKAEIDAMLASVAPEMARK